MLLVWGHALGTHGAGFAPFVHVAQAASGVAVKSVWLWHTGTANSWHTLAKSAAATSRRGSVVQALVWSCVTSHPLLVGTAALQLGAEPDLPAAANPAAVDITGAAAVSLLSVNLLRDTVVD